MPHLGNREVRFLGDLLRRGLAAELLDERGRGPRELVDRFDHVHRYVDGPGLVGNRPGHRLADPPRGVGRELVPAPVLELFDAPHEPEISFLDQLEELEAAEHVFLGDGDDQPEVGHGQLMPRLLHRGHAIVNLADGFLDLDARDAELLFEAPEPASCHGEALFEELPLLRASFLLQKAVWWGDRGRQRRKLVVDLLQDGDQSIESQGREADLLDQSRDFGDLPIDGLLQAQRSLAARVALSLSFAFFLGRRSQRSS